MNNEKIKQWLTNPTDYNEGVALYALYGKNKNILRVLQRRVWIEKLLWELNKLAGTKYNPVVTASEINIGAIPLLPKEGSGFSRGVVPTKPLPNNIKVKESAAPQGKLTILDGTINYADLTPEQKLIYDSIRDTYKIMRATHEKMKLATTDEQRAELRKQLCKDDDTVRNNWQKLDSILKP